MIGSFVQTMSHLISQGKTVTQPHTNDLPGALFWALLERWSKPVYALLRAIAIAWTRATRRA